MINFKDWFNSQESSAATRARTAAFWGLGPDIASPFSHSTPHPGMVDKLLSKLKKKKKKKKKKLEENKGQVPDYSFDSFVKKLTNAKSNIEKDISDAELEDEELEDDESEEENDEDNLEEKSPKKTIDYNKEKDDNLPQSTRL